MDITNSIDSHAKIDDFKPMFLRLRKSIDFLTNADEIISQWQALFSMRLQNEIAHHEVRITKDSLSDKNPQLFVKELYLQGHEINLHISVNSLYKLAQTHSSPQAVPLDIFSQRDMPQKIMYASTTFKSKHLTDETPIIIIPLNLGNAIGFVADGNHRISAKKKSSYKTIQAYSPNYIMVGLTLGNSFEETLYCMMGDMNIISLAKMQDPSMIYYEGQLFEFCSKPSRGERVR